MVGGVTKGAWSEEEDTLLQECIEKYGEGKWHQIPVRAGLNRCRKSCRLRWLNYLRPNIKKGNFSPDEIDLILRLHRLLGNRWSIIAARLPGRTANHVKNYWSTHQSKKYKHKQEPDFGTAKPTEATTRKSIVLKPRPRTSIRPNVISSLFSGDNKLATINPNNHSNTGIPSNKSITDEAFSSPLALKNNDMELFRGLLENDGEKSGGIWPSQQEGDKKFWWEETPIFNNQGNNDGNGAGDDSGNKFENETLIWDNYVNASAFDMDIWDISEIFRATK